VLTVLLAPIGVMTLLFGKQDSILALLTDIAAELLSIYIVVLLVRSVWRVLDASPEE